MTSYDWKITLEKIIRQILIVGIAGVLAIYAQEPWLLALAPAAEGLLNWLKHKDD